jgi:hypothetical protein
MSTPKTQDDSGDVKGQTSSKGIYTRPGKIKNEFLLYNIMEDGLKSCLSEMYDYVVVKYDAWQCFKQWYGCDYEVERKIVRTVDENNIVLENLQLYP